jgi:hypothetical protein
MDEHCTTNTEPLGHVHLSGIKIWKDTFNKLHLDLSDGTSFDDIRIVNPFPLSSPDLFIQFENQEGKEIGFIGSLNELDRESRQNVREALELRHFVTQVTAVNSITGKHGMTTWDFATERGTRVVHVKERTDIRFIPPGRIVFTDVHGMKFEIRDSGALDQRSRELLETEI